jgi:hypothetical protein
MIPANSTGWRRAARSLSPRRPRFPIPIRRAFTMPMGGVVVNCGEGVVGRVRPPPRLLRRARPRGRQRKLALVSKVLVITGGPGQAVNLVHDHDIDFAGPRLGEKRLQGRAVELKLRRGRHHRSGRRPSCQ